MTELVRDIAEGLADVPLSDWIALAVVLIVVAVVAYAIGSPHFYGGDTPDYTGVAFHSRYAPGTYGAAIEQREKSERTRRASSYVGALALLGLGVLCLLGGWRTNDIVVLILAMLLLGAAVITARTTRAGEMYGSNAHLAGMVLAGVAVGIAVAVPALLPSTWFMACVSLGIVAVVALGIGRG